MASKIGLWLYFISGAKEISSIVTFLALEKSPKTKITSL